MSTFAQRRTELLDARRGNDPTKTFRLRAKMRAEGDRRWQTLARTVRQALIEHDLVGLRSMSKLPFGDKTEGFATWLREELRQKVLGFNGSWLFPYVQQAADMAQTRAVGLLPVHDAFDPDEPRDPQGKWTSTGAAINTPQFKEWFGESKVVDDKGKPLVVYHGTSQGKEFNQFSSENAPYRGGILAFFSTSSKFASSYAARSDEGPENARVIPVYLKAENPFDFRKDWRTAEDFYEQTGGVTDDMEANRILMGLHKAEDITTGPGAAGLSKEDFVKVVKEGGWDALENNEFVEWLRNAGHDAIITLELNAINYGVFEPSQIKSAISNTGEFSSRKPGIKDAGDRVTTMQNLAVSELKGIIAAAAQQITRAVTHCMMANASPTATANAAAGCIKVMRNRTRAMSEYIVAKTHATSTLSSFRAAGVTHVGIDPERKRKPRARLYDAFDPDEPRDPHGQWTSGGGLLDAPMRSQSVNVIVRPLAPSDDKKYAEVLVNPTERSLLCLAKEDPEQAIRHLEDKHGNQFFWKASQAIHGKVQEALRLGGAAGLSETPTTGGMEWYVAKRLAPVLRDKLKQGRDVAKSAGYYGDRRVFDKELPDPEEEAAARHEMLVEAGLEEGVEVLTAGDNYVCPVCEEISENGPYDLDEAEDLIPAHSFCRCAFVPASDARFASVHDYDPEQPREASAPGHSGGEFASWGGASHGETVSSQQVAVVTELGKKTPGLKNLLPYLAPDEVNRLKKTTVEQMVDAFTKFPVKAEEMAAVAFSGSAKRGWYRKSAEAVVSVFGAADAPRFAALMAAMSPQTGVEDNAINALNMWVNWSRAGRPTDRDHITKLLGQSVQGEKGEGSILPAWINNSVMALSVHNPEDVVLSGPKVDSFAHNLRGHVNAVTHDTWMANYFGVEQALFARRSPVPGKTPGKGPFYIAASAVTRKAAEILTEKTGSKWTPDQIQETIWSWAKTLYEHATKDKTTVEQLLKAGSVTHDDIADTPDFATLFTQNIYRKILESGGYGKQASALATSGGESIRTAGGGGSLLEAKGSGIEQAAFTRFLTNAAKRLDKTRARRAAAKAEKSEDGLIDFDPDQPRDPAGISTGGQWSKVAGEVGHQFVSPNVGSGDFAAARKELGSARQNALRNASMDIDSALGLGASPSDAIGAWKDGAENSIITRVDYHPDWDKLKLSGAMKGYLADQKSVLVFQQHDEGKAVLYHMLVQEPDLQKLHENLLADGLAFHTIMPYGKEGEHLPVNSVFVADLDGSAHDAVAKAAERYHADVDYQFGQAEFIGTTKQDGTDREQRDDARRAYQEIIQQSPVPEGQGIWEGIHNQWGETLGITPPGELDPRVTNVGGDEWNKKTAVRLETEYQSAKPDLEKIVADAVGGKADFPLEWKVVPHPGGEGWFAIQNIKGDYGLNPTGVGEAKFATETEAILAIKEYAPEQKFIEPTEDPIPSSWDEIGDTQQEEIKTAWMENTKQEFLNAETESWQNSEDPMEQTKSVLAYEFKNGKSVSDDYVKDALTELFDERKEAEEAEIPFDEKQLTNALSFNYEAGSGKDVEVEWDDTKLTQPKGWVEEPTLPGIEPEKTSDKLTKEMRDDIEAKVIEAFNKEAEDKVGGAEPPEYLSESAEEYQDQSWDSKDDKEKLEWAVDNGHIEDPTKVAPEKKWSGELTELPAKFDPLGERDTTKDYTLTKLIGEKLSVERATDVLMKRGVFERRDMAERAAHNFENRLWTSWKGDSASTDGLILQAATGAELGGRFRNPNPGMLGDKYFEESANDRFGSAGGWEGVKAYVRAKWETSQYLLDKANKPTVDVYRGYLTKNKGKEEAVLADFPEFISTPPYNKLPDIVLDRNGAQSTTTDLLVANKWNGIGASSKGFDPDEDRVVLRVTAPRTAVLSLPAYGQNHASEKEVILAGTAWRKWDAWHQKAPSFTEVPI